jgi:four helix bundle protein
MQSYRDLEIYKMAFNLAFEVKDMTMKLPKYELYEQGSQIRRASQSIKDNIVEGYGRRRYKADYIKYLIYAQSSNDETLNQLNMLSQMYFKDNPLNQLIDKYETLGRGINNYIKYVEKNWRT